MRVYVLLYDSGQENEGIHSLELAGQVVVLMFENIDDANRYAGLLEAQDFPNPSIEGLDREEIEAFCRESGYEARFVEAGFVPKTDEDRLLLSPPERNKDVSNWKNNDESQTILDTEIDDLEKFRSSLEDLM